MDKPDAVAPLEPDEEEGATAIEEMGGDAVEAPITIDTASVPSVDYTSEQKYKVVLRGLNDVFDDQFRDRFDQLSVLRGGEGDEANVAQISRRAEEDVELLQRKIGRAPCRERE